MSKNKWGYAVQPNTFCAIDASTNSLAFALFNTKDGTLGSVGKINFEGHDIYEKVMDAGQKVKAFLDFYNGFEAIIIEHTVFMNSPKTAADLALVQGAILGAAHHAARRLSGCFHARRATAAGVRRTCVRVLSCASAQLNRVDV